MSNPRPADHTLAALRGEDPAQAERDRRVVEALSGADPYGEEREDALREALAGKSTREAQESRLKAADVKLATEAYATALVRALPRSETTASAARRAEAERVRFMNANRAKHATEQELLGATASYLTGLAAVHRRD